MQPWQRGLRLQDQQRTLQTVSKTNTNLQSRVTEVETQVHEVKQQINDLQQDVASKLEALKQESQAKMQQLHVLLEQMQAVQVQTVSAPAAPCEAEAQSSAESEHFQPFLRDPVFMEEEEEAPLLLQNKGFLQGDVAAVLQQTASWPALLGLSGDHPKIVDVEAKALDVEVERIIERDIERTFLKDHNRCALQRVLRVLALEFNNYAQAMCYVTAYLMLTHTDATAAAMVRVINNNEKYIPGYWRTEAAAFGTDAFVFKALLEDHDSELAEHLVSCCISPETYLQKWFTALCIQNLPFKIGIRFLELFMEHGYVWLFKFGLAIHRHFREPLLAAKQPNALYKILRLEHETDSIDENVLSKALQYDLSGKDIPGLRQKMYDTIIGPRLEKARQLAEEAEDDDMSDFSDEDEE